MNGCIEGEGPFIRRRRFQFGLRTLLLLTLLASVALSWFSVRLSRAQRQRAAVEAIQACAIGTNITYDYELDANGDRLPGARPPAPEFLVRLLGKHFFCEISSVSVFGLSDEDMRHLAEFRNVRFLDLNCDNLTDRGLRHLAKLPQLKSLRVGSQAITDDGLRHLRGLGKLQDLNLCCTRITGEGFKHLKGSSNLEELLLTWADITDEGLRHIAEMPSVKHLDLDGVPVSDAGLRHLERMPQLRAVSLAGTRVTEAGSQRLSESLPQCQVAWAEELEIDFDFDVDEDLFGDIDVALSE